MDGGRWPEEEEEARRGIWKGRRHKARRKQTSSDRQELMGFGGLGLFKRLHVPHRNSHIGYK